MTQLNIPIPIELQHSFFFADQDGIEVGGNSSCGDTPFIQEIEYYAGIRNEKPWTNTKEEIPMLLQHWKEIKDEIRIPFDMRMKEKCIVSMRKGLAMFLQFLHWVNGVPTALNPRILYDNLAIKPMNVNERVHFIITRPTLHHSYMQLVELMVEMEKLFYKHLILKNREQKDV